MVSSNQEVIDETANTTEDYKIRVSKAFNTKKPIRCNLCNNIYYNVRNNNNNLKKKSK